MAAPPDLFARIFRVLPAAWVSALVLLSAPASAAIDLDAGRPPRARAGEPALQGPRADASQVPAKPLVRPVPRHPLPAATARSGATQKLPFELQFFHPGLYYDQPVRDLTRSSTAQRARSRSTPSFSTTARTTSTPSVLRGLGVRRLSRALRAQHAEIQGRGAGVPGRELFPRARQGPALRAVRARARRRHGARLRRGVPALHRILDRAARAGREGAHDLRAARFAARHRRLSLRAAARRGNGNRRAGAHLPARAR